MKQINQILVAIDRSVMAAEALRRAISIAKEKDAQLIVMHVIEPSFIESPFVHTTDDDEVKKQIIEQIDQLNSEADLKYILFVKSGSAAASITLKVEKTNADLLIIGTHGKNDIDSSHFGSTTLKLIQNTHIPVLIVKNEVKTIYQKMIAPTNLSEYSKESILFANALFTKLSRKYIHAFDTFSELSNMTFGMSKEEGEILSNEMFISAKTALSEFMKEVGNGETSLIYDTASLNEDLLAYISNNGADLLVLGSKGIADLNSFVFGSTASFLVENSPIDVLVYVPVKPYYILDS